VDAGGWGGEREEPPVSPAGTTRGPNLETKRIAAAAELNDVPVKICHLLVLPLKAVVDGLDGKLRVEEQNLARNK